jgi:hypothetical protein
LIFADFPAEIASSEEVSRIPTPVAMPPRGEVMRMTTIRTAAALLAASLAGHAPASERDLLAPHMKVLGVNLESTTLEGAQRLLGRATPRRNGGDAAASTTAECYVGRDGTMLVLVSGELGGGKIITAFELVTREELADFSGGESYLVPAEKRPRCAPGKRLSRSTATQGGLRLGMTEAEVRRLLGPPKEAADDHLVFTSEGTEPMTPEQRKASSAQNAGTPADSFDRFRSVRVELEWGRAIAIRVSQATTF